MANNLQQRYQEIQTERELIQKTVAELTTKQTNLESELTRLNLNLQFQVQGVNRSVPTWFVAGGRLSTA